MSKFKVGDIVTCQTRGLTGSIMAVHNYEHWGESVLPKYNVSYKTNGDYWSWETLREIDLQKLPDDQAVEWMLKYG